MITSAVLLALCLVSLVWFVRKDLADYRAFKLLTETADRQRRYRGWLLKSFLLFPGGGVVALAVLGRLHALVALPPEFRPLFLALQASGAASGDFIRGLIAGAAGAVAGVIAIGFLLRRFSRRKAGPIYAGDVAALLPRNGAETVWTALLAVNAGVGEEIYFRLLLPLLLVGIWGHVPAAFVLACLIFGGVHFYQGIAGVLATTVLGGALAALYLWTGSLFIAMAAHAVLDLIGLVVRPTLARMAASRAEART